MAYPGYEDMEGLTIRRAGQSDIPLIRGMADVVFRKTYADILSPAQMEYMMEWMYSGPSLSLQVSGPGRSFHIAEVSGVPAGYVSFEEDGTAGDGRLKFHLQKLYVMPAYQGRGLGKALLDHVFGILRRDNPDGCRVELNVNRNNPAVGFYEHCGLVRDREGDFPIGNGFFMNDYIYSKDL